MSRCSCLHQWQSSCQSSSQTSAPACILGHCLPAASSNPAKVKDCQKLTARLEATAGREIPLSQLLGSLIACESSTSFQCTWLALLVHMTDCTCKLKSCTWRVSHGHAQEVVATVYVIPAKCCRRRINDVLWPGVSQAVSGPAGRPSTPASSAAPTPQKVTWVGDPFEVSAHKS
jgi:hypothetical protein